MQVEFDTDDGVGADRGAGARDEIAFAVVLALTTMAPCRLSSTISTGPAAVRSARMVSRSASWTARIVMPEGCALAVMLSITVRLFSDAWR